MIPIQDVIPTRRTPAATLVLMLLNVAGYAGMAAGLSVPSPFVNIAVVPLLLSLLYLWVFGDNAEARLGRFVFVVLYIAGGFLPGIGAAGAVTALLGSYFALLPQSRVLVLAPLPEWLVEVPAVFLLGVWAVLHLLQFVARPRTMWMFALAFVMGAVTARLIRPRVQW